MRSLPLVLILSVISPSLHASLVMYPGLDADFSIPGGTGDTQTTGSITISTSPDHQYTDPDSDPPSTTNTRYYGGSVNFVASSNEWGSQARLVIGGAGDDVVFRAGGGAATWQIEGSSSTASTGLARSSAFDFIIKLEDTAWNTTAIHLFLGANANTAIEGTPDFSANINNLMAPNQLTLMSWTLSTESWDTGASLSVLHSFSSTEWTPLSSIPEPSAAWLLALVTVAGWSRHRRR